MSTASAARTAETYLPTDTELATVHHLAQMLRDRGMEPPEPRPRLVDGTGRILELPDSVYDVLEKVVEAMSQGMGVTVAPSGAMLTTQEAANFLGISRPTLVKLLTADRIPYETRGRHRRVRLVDLVAYQRAQRHDTATALADAARTGEEAGIYDEFYSPDRPTR